MVGQTQADASDPDGSGVPSGAIGDKKPWFRILRPPSPARCWRLKPGSSAAAQDIEHWLRGQWQEHTPPFYGSVDLRNSGFKLAPVDMNLFPGGFNNLNSAFMPLCVQAAMSGDREDLPERQAPAAHSGKPHAQSLLLAECRAARRHPAPDRPRGAPRLAVCPRSTSRHRRRPAQTARRSCSNRWCSSKYAARPRWLRPVRHPAQQRSLGRHSRRSSKGPRRSVRPAAAACRLGSATQVESLCRLRRSRRRLRQAARHRPVADQPVLFTVRAV